VSLDELGTAKSTPDASFEDVGIGPPREDASLNVGDAAAASDADAGALCAVQDSLTLVCEDFDRATLGAVQVPPGEFLTSLDGGQRTRGVVTAYQSSEPASSAPHYYRLFTENVGVGDGAMALRYRILNGPRAFEAEARVWVGRTVRGAASEFLQFGLAGPETQVWLHAEQLVVNIKGDLKITAAAALPRETWVRVRVRYTLDGNQRAMIRVFVNDTLWAETVADFGGTSSAPQLTTFMLGPDHMPAGHDDEFRFDDVRLRSL
jgi:hypothetical protein